MKKAMMTIVTTLVLGSVSLFAQSSADAILGEWTTAAKDAVFQIYKKDNKYFGKILSGEGGDTRDVKNPDEKLRSRELVGLTILSNFVFKGNTTWEDGTIYDPKNGKTYSCKLTLQSSNQLDVRGYVGISMFGRTEKWTRVK